jgi:subtilisin family serine protease
MKNTDFTLPPYKITNVVTTLSQNVGWGLLNVFNDIPKAWTVTQGEGIRVLVIDTGCPISFANGKPLHVHPDLEGAIDVEASKSFIPDEDMRDRQSHSTHCSGIIGARNNEIGMVGVAPKCTIITYKGLSDTGSGTMQCVTNALLAAIELKPDIISMSLGAEYGDLDLHNAIKKLHDMNIPIICASGNEGHDTRGYPAYYAETISVGAIDKTGKIANFSSSNEEVDFVGAGVDIYSTVCNDRYAMMSGTSMATPWVAGVVALLLAKHRDQEAKTGKNDCKTVEQVREHLRKYSTKEGVLGQPRDNWYGYGLVRVDKMILDAESIDEPVVDPLPGDIPIKKKTSMLEKIRNFFRKIAGR